MSAFSDTDLNRPDAGPSRDLDGFAVVRSDTALAFLVAPAVPAALAALVLALAALCEGSLGGAFLGFWLVFLALAFGGYASALVVGVPAYLLVRAWTLSIPPAAATLCGGVVAALPWTALAIAEREGAWFVGVGLIFALGCVGGLAFSVVRDGSPWRDVEARGER